ncbi:MAG: hypothetical protein M3N46_07760, partial [Actinomycetota bacterium]|nr:hypothetical protein [Actinomycetota bacterium]
MAFVRTFEYRQKLGRRIQKVVRATWTLTWESGRAIIQIDTYGAPERELPDKSSQTIQFDERSVLEFVRICER